MITVLRGDCAEKLPELAAGSVDAICTDPPYHIGFMGRSWDAAQAGVAFDPATWGAALRVLKPGGHLLAFGGTRTYHRLGCAIEDAGFEIRDSLHWMYGSGFPKSLNVGKAIDKRPGVRLHREFAQHLAERREAAGLTRADVAERVAGTRTGACWNWEHHQFPEAKWWPALRDLLGLDDARWGPVIAEAEREVTGQGHRVRRESTVQIAGVSDGAYDITAPATEDAARWEGWGTALKPGHEPIILARKPLAGTVAANVLAHGTGALNVDGCRVGATTETHASKPRAERNGFIKGFVDGTETVAHNHGRWPPNILLTHSAECVPTGMRQVRNPSGGIRGDEPSAVTDAVYAGRQRVPWRAHGGPDGTEAVEAWDCIEGCPVAALDAQSGHLSSWMAKANHTVPPSNEIYGRYTAQPVGPQNQYGDTGGASRFFPQLAWSPEYDAPFLYQAKAGRKERPRIDGVATHPTVKPVAPMRWLVRLVTPPGGLVVDPFAGTGTTGEACHLEGFDCVLVERDADYIKLIDARMGKYAQEAA